MSSCLPRHLSVRRLWSSLPASFSSSRCAHHTLLLCSSFSSPAVQPLASSARAHSSSPSSPSSPPAPSSASAPPVDPSACHSLQRVLLYRHAESLGNIGEQSPQTVGDHSLSLSPLGFQQAQALGQRLGRSFFLPPSSRPPPLVYISPYTRTRQTLRAVAAGADVPLSSLRLYEDPRLRELEFGIDPQTKHDLSLEAQEPLREVHGYLYYRFRGGESPADCYDRVSSWLGTMWREVGRTGAEQVVVFSHGLTLRCLLMRWLHLRVEEFDALENPRHCEGIQLLRGAGKGDEVGEKLTRGKPARWSVRGVKLREEWKDWREEEWKQGAATASLLQSDGKAQGST